MYSISDDTDTKFVLAALFPLHDNDVYSFGFERVIERYPHSVLPIDRPVNDLYGIKIISGNNKYFRYKKLHRRHHLYQK